MSTKALRRLVDHYRRIIGAGFIPREIQLVDAIHELEAIERAAKALDRLSVGDFAYTIRDREKTMRETPDVESTWNHPDVKAWSDASVLMQRIAKDAP